jgi:DNA-binding XRE family transcriptional regulator
MARPPTPPPAAPFWQDRRGLELFSAHLLPGGRELEVRFRFGQSYRLEPAALGLEGRAVLATIGADPRTLVVGLARGGLVDVPSTAILTLAEPAYRAALTRKATTVGARVRALRLAQGRTAMEVAAASGMARSNFARLEAGRHEPRLATLRRVAEALGVPPDALLG